MTGVQAGSGGTGLLEGSRPGTGVTGGTPVPPFVSGTENVLLELNAVPVGAYSETFDLRSAAVFDSLTLPVPNPINLIAVTEDVTQLDVAVTPPTDDLTTPVPLAIDQIAVTETVDPADVASAVVTDDLVGQLPVEAAIMATAPRYYWPIARQNYVNNGTGGAEPLAAISAPPFIDDPVFVSVPNTAAGDAFTTDSAALPSTPNMALNTGFTIGLFAKLDGTSPATNYLMNCGNTPGGFNLRNFDCWVDAADESVTFQVYDGAGARTAYTSPIGSFPVDGLWHHVACQYDLSNVRIWVDGVLELTTARAVAQGNTVAQRIVIGGIDGSGNGAGAGAAYVDGASNAIPSVVHPFLSPGGITTAQILAIAEAAGVA